MRGRMLEFEFGTDFFNVNDIGISDSSSVEVELMEYLTKDASGICLVIGLGTCVASRMIHEKGCRQFVIEKHQQVIDFNADRIREYEIVILHNDWIDAVRHVETLEKYFDFCLFDVYPFPDDIDDITQIKDELVEKLVSLIKIDGFFAIFRDREHPRVLPKSLELESIFQPTNYKYLGQIYRRK